MSEHPPFKAPRRFRKTAEELAEAFKARLSEMGVDATLDEVVLVVRGKAPKGLVTTMVEAWTEDERKRGIVIV